MNAPHGAPHDWALVLAGGQGRRIAHLTRDTAGVSVPKQFCSLGRGSSLVHQALRRARAVAPPERTLVSVTQCHESWWRPLQGSMPADNLLVQPEQRGTGIGILHALLEILRRDAAACVAILPADHYFRNDATITDGLRTAMQLTRKHPRQILLLGFEPEEFDGELGYIVPAHGASEGLCGVGCFVEKPGPDQARALIDQGALWNSFILAADGHALLELYERHCPAVVARLRAFLVAPLEPAARRAELARLFREIPSIDFSEDVITTDIDKQRVLPLPRCGWCDLGTPARLDRVLRRHGDVIDAAPVAVAGTGGHVDLAARSRAVQRGSDSSSSSLRS